MDINSLAHTKWNCKYHTEIGKKLKHMPYNELGELVQEVKAENYEQI